MLRTMILKSSLWARLHGGGGPQVGEVTCLGGVTRLSIQSVILIWSRLHDEWGDPPHVISPTWGLPPPCKQALNVIHYLPLQVFTSVALFNMLISPLNAFPWVLNGLMEAWVSVKRIQAFLSLNNQDLTGYYGQLECSDKADSKFS